MSELVCRDRGTNSAAPRRRKLRFLVLSFLCLAGIIYFAPEIVLRTPLRQMAFEHLLPQYAGRIEVDSVTVGWRSPIEMRGIRYCDANVDLVIESAHCDRTLFDLVLNPGDCGRVQLETTRVIVRNRSQPVSAGGTATETGASPHAATPAPSSNRPRVGEWPSVDVAGTGGSVSIQGPDGRVIPIVHRIDFEFRAPAAGPKAGFAVLARVGDPGTTSHVSARGSLEWPCRSILASLNELCLELVGLDTAVFDPLCAVAGIPVSLSRVRSENLRVNGTVTGTAALRSDASRAAANSAVSFNMNMEISPIELAGRADEWSFDESAVTISGVGRLASGSLQLDSFQIASDSLGLEAAGTVTDCLGQAVANLHGAARCDWQKLGTRLRPFLHEDVSVTGSSRRPWRLRGPLAAAAGSQPLDQLQIDVATAWQAFRVLDFESGPLELVAHGRNGRVAFDPLTTTFQDGHIALEPSIELAPTPVLTISPGRVLQNVTVDSALCEWILQYVDPLATVSGDLRGRLSLELDELEIPLAPDGLQRAVIQGRILLDDAEFSPARSLHEILATAGIQIPENLRTSQTIAIRLQDGRVYHEGLAIPLKDEQVTLDGWVGLDHSMQIRMSLPVTEQMVGRDKRLYRLLRGQRVEVPITGTLERPTVNEDALSRNIQRLIQTALRDNFMNEDALRGLLRRAIK